MSTSQFKLPTLLSNQWLIKPSNEQEISELPTLGDIKKKLTEIEFKFPPDREKHLSAGMPDELKKHLGIDHICDDKSKFIFTRTQMASSLKPNITQSHFLYRGEKKDYGSSKATVYRCSANHLIENIKLAEFNILLESHPMVKMLMKGIKLSNEVELKLNNPYGIAQHYGFKTSLIDLTSDIDIASFFATTEHNKESDSYEIFKDNPYGVLYVYHMSLPFTHLTKMDGLSSIGLQPFPRPGIQKGFLWNCHPDFDKKNKSVRDLKDSSYVTTIYFRHDEKFTKSIIENTDHGRKIFPVDELSEMALEISNNTEFSQESFDRNLGENPRDNKNNNIKILKENGISINPNKQPYSFDNDNLESFYLRMHNGGWDQFCDQIEFPFEDNEILKAALRNVIKNPLYKEFFGC